MGLVWRDARSLAGGVLDDLWDRTLPVDVTAICHAMGVAVCRHSMPGGVSGMVVKRRDGMPRLYVAREDPEPVRRFACAHGLGHCLERRAMGDVEYGFEDSFADMGTRIRRPDYAPLEFHADVFALALLMPEDAILRFDHERMSVDRMVRLFGVTVSMARRRLTGLRDHPTATPSA